MGVDVSVINTHQRVSISRGMLLLQKLSTVLRDRLLSACTHDGQVLTYSFLCLKLLECFPCDASTALAQLVKVVCKRGQNAYDFIHMFRDMSSKTTLTVDQQVQLLLPKLPAYFRRVWDTHKLTLVPPYTYNQLSICARSLAIDFERHTARTPITPALIGSVPVSPCDISSEAVEMLSVCSSDYDNELVEDELYPVTTRTSNRFSNTLTPSDFMHVRGSNRGRGDSSRFNNRSTRQRNSNYANNNNIPAYPSASHPSTHTHHPCVVPAFSNTNAPANQVYDQTTPERATYLDQQSGVNRHQQPGVNRHMGPLQG